MSQSKHEEKHAEKSTEKHAEKPAEKVTVKYERPPPAKGTQRVRMGSGEQGDEITVSHGTKTYHVPRSDGLVDLPPEAAEHVIRQGGAEPVIEAPEPPEGNVNVKHISDPKTLLSYGQEVFTPDKDGVVSIPRAGLDLASSHGFLPVD